jgi:acyl-coenzyme A synthetase/AMP-(fatty) acid ligase
LSIPVKLNTFTETELLTVNKVVFTGSVFPSSDLAVWQKHLPDAFFMNQYGPTEITASCTYHVIDHPVKSDEILPIGLPFQNTQIILLSDEGVVVAQGEKGEICVAGSCLALGYLNNYELTKQSFVENPANKTYPQIIYKTGDIGSIDANGTLWFHGRKDSQIKHMGYRVELSEIEQAANSLEGIKISVCLYDSERAYIYLFYEGTATVKEIASELRHTLPGYMVPRKFIALDALPRTQNGKIDRNKLKEQFE